MKKKSQIRKYTVEKVEELTKTQTIPEMLKMYAEHVSEKKNKLKQKKATLQAELNHTRKKTEKVVNQMVDNVGDRLERNEMVVMNARSRPTNEDVKAMADLFSYMQNQTELILINSNKMEQLGEFLNQKVGEIQYPVGDYTQLDQQFAHLQKLCAEEEAEKARLQQERDKNREFYQNIKQTIEECRKQYEIVEGKICEREKQLDHLVSYFATRQREDRQKIEYENNMTQMLENELLKAQQIFNYNSQKDRNLGIAQIELSKQSL